MTDPFKTERETTKRLFDSILVDRQAECWSVGRQMVANVFNHYYTRALSVKQVDGVARAVERLAENQSLQDALTFYVKHQVLRSRKGDNGTRLYEVNF